MSKSVLLNAWLLRAVLPMAPQAEVDAMPPSLNTFAAACSPQVVESVAFENIPSNARTGPNRPRCSLRHAAVVKACLPGVNFGQTVGIA
jgi:hypothetical protein